MWLPLLVLLARLCLQTCRLAVVLLTLLSTAGGFAATAIGMADHTQVAYERVHLVLQALQSFKVYLLLVILAHQLLAHRRKSLSMRLLLRLLLRLDLGTLWVMLLLPLWKHLLALLLLLWQLLQHLLWTPLLLLQHLLWAPLLLRWHLPQLLWHLPVLLHC